MANPEHKETLDWLDKVSVCLYRLGISAFSIAILAYSLVAFSQLGFVNIPELLQWGCIVTLCISSALTAANLHVYSKHVRVIIVWSSWIGLLLMLYGIQSGIYWLALGFLFVTFSGVSLKESFCFKVFGLKLVPLLLAINTFSIMLQAWYIVAFCSAVTGLIMMYLSVQKWKMPLHFDIGIKANYEV